MANSLSVSQFKEKVIKSVIKNDTIVTAIDAVNLTANNLINTHIFRYHQNPNTLNKDITFLTFQVHIPTIRDKVWAKPQLEIWIISDEKRMNITNIPKVTANRNDYISQLLDDMLNGSIGYGFGKLTLLSNVEGAFSEKYLYRRMIFEGTDLNDSVCNGD